MGRLDDIADRVELRALVDAYCLAADTRDKEGFAATFAADGVLEVGTELQGAEQISSPLDYLGLHYTRTMHFVGTHVVELAGDTATGLAYCLAHHLSGEGPDQKVNVMAIRYEDSYVRTTAGWRFARRTMNPDWEEERVAFPPRPAVSGT